MVDALHQMMVEMDNRAASADEIANTPPEAPQGEISPADPRAQQMI